MASLVNNGSEGVVHISFSKAFDTVSCCILTQKLMRYELDEPILSEADRKVAEWLGPKDDQRHEF